MTVEKILSQAFRLGRDLEAHADERKTNPDNYDSVCDHVSTEMENLMGRLYAVLNLKPHKPAAQIAA